LYVLMTQSLAALMPGPPVRRGPMESKRVCDSVWTWELSMPSRQMRSSVASSVGKWGADCAAADAASATVTKEERRGRRESDIASTEESRGTERKQKTPGGESLTARCLGSGLGVSKSRRRSEPRLERQLSAAAVSCFRYGEVLVKPVTIPSV